MRRAGLDPQRIEDPEEELDVGHLLVGLTARNWAASKSGAWASNVPRRDLPNRNWLKIQSVRREARASGSPSGGER